MEKVAFKLGTGRPIAAQEEGALGVEPKGVVAHLVVNQGGLFLDAVICHKDRLSDRKFGHHLPRLAFEQDPTFLCVSCARREEPAGGDRAPGSKRAPPRATGAASSKAPDAL